MAFWPVNTEMILDIMAMPTHEVVPSVSNQNALNESVIAKFQCCQSRTMSKS